MKLIPISTSAEHQVNGSNGSEIYLALRGCPRLVSPALIITASKVRSSAVKAAVCGLKVQFLRGQLLPEALPTRHLPTNYSAQPILCSSDVYLLSP